jgi:hypothetical protein
VARLGGYDERRRSDGKASSDAAFIPRRACGLSWLSCGAWDFHASLGLCGSLLTLAFDLEKSSDMVGARRLARRKQVALVEHQAGIGRVWACCVPALPCRSTLRCPLALHGTRLRLASQRPIARGFASRSTGLAGRVRQYAANLEIRAARRVFCGPGDRQAAGPVTGTPTIIPPGERRWDSEASSEAAGRRERTTRMSWHVWAWKPSVRAACTQGAIGRLTPRPWERRMLQNE